MTADLLVEIGMEECPARFLPPAREQLRAEAERLLVQARLAHGPIQVFGTPRRLAVLVSGVAQRQEDWSEEVKGPPRRAAFDAEGRPTRAAEGFARQQGVALEELQIRETPQGSYVFAVRRHAGRLAVELLPDLVRELIGALSFPKSMRWGDYDVRFVRPIRWLVALYGQQVLPVEVAGVRADRFTRGHRFLAPGPVALPEPSAYVEVLRRAWVLADPQVRRERIRNAIAAVAEQSGDQVAWDEELLDEVTDLVEFPTPVVGSFAPAYLELPPEVLITPMKEHQRYFPVLAADGRLRPRFVAVRNGGEGNLEVIRAGYEKVLAARLADARFFYEEDRKVPLPERVEALRQVVWQEGLGTLYDKVQRVVGVVERLAVGWPEPEAAWARRAAQLCKADLTTHMVYEFPELQGVMGREYARLAGEPEPVAQALFEHLLPRGAGDALPTSRPGALVSVADKIDSIVGLFSAGLAPTGSQDPYGLRRQALGIVRILLAGILPMDLGQIVAAGVAGYRDRLGDPARLGQEVMEFLLGRLRGLLTDMGLRYDVVDAVLAVSGQRPAEALARGQALAQLLGSPVLDALVTAFQRVARLATQAQGAAAIDPSRFREAAERALWQAVETARPEVEACLARGEYAQALDRLAQLRPVVDRFFNDVLVMDPDPDLRANRLALLRATAAVLGTVADLSKLAL